MTHDDRSVKDSVQQLLDRLDELKVRLWVEDDQLRVSAPRGALTAEMQAELRDRKSELMSTLAARTPDRVVRSETLEPAPLTLAQERIWLFDQLEPGSTTFNMQVLLELHGALDMDALVGAMKTVVERHESLRTTFREDADGPVQVIGSSVEPVVHLVDLAGVDQAEREAEVRQALREERETPFDLAKGPPFRVTVIRTAEERHLLVVAAHHIVADGSSLIVLVTEWAELYRAARTGETPDVLPLPVRYVDYARWERAWLDGEDAAQLEQYWRDTLSGVLPVLELPTDHPRLPTQTFRGGAVSERLGTETLDRLRALARESGTTVFSVLLAAFKATLFRHTGQPDVIVGAALAGRSRPETRHLVGVFVNTVAVRSDLSDEPSFRDLLDRVGDATRGAIGHGELPFDRVVALSGGQRDRSRPPVFQVLFNAFNAEAPSEIQLPDLKVTVPDADDLLKLFEVESKFDLTAYSRETADGIDLQLVYNADLFEHARIEELMCHYVRFVEQIATDPDGSIGSVDVTDGGGPLGVGEQAEPVVHRGELDLIDAFRTIVAASPNAVAVKGSEAGVTWSELDTLSDRVAHALLSRQGGPPARVGLVFEPEPELFAAILGALKAGVSFVPLDPINPVERLTHMVSDADIGVVLTDRNSRDLTSRLEAVESLVVEDLEESSTLETPDVAPDDEAYVLYTSGSTGKPKGVSQSRGATLGHARAYAGSLDMGPEDRVLMIASYGFDAALMDIFSAFVSGATLVPIHLQNIGLHRLADRIRADGVTIYHSTPTAFRTLRSVARDSELSTVRAVVLGGEAVRRSDVTGYERLFPNAVFVNQYGPSESSTALRYQIDPSTPLSAGPVPIGFPTDGTEVVLLNEDGGVADVVGEISIRGPWLAAGYVGGTPGADDRFTRTSDGTRQFRTGDMARRRPDGALVFTGRRDDQVKIRGFRIEIGEVETALLALSTVTHAAVRVDGNPGEEHLVAFALVEDSEVDGAALRSALADRVPPYMLPRRVVVLPEFPLTATGKVDRLRLPEVGAEVPDGEATAPRDGIEDVVAAIWSEVLGRVVSNVFDDFFDLGGNSLQATQVVSRVERVTGQSIQLRDFFAGPTIAAVAEVVRSESAPPVNIPPLEPRGEDGPVPLSFAQERMWFVQEVDPETTAYNVAGAVWLEGALDVEFLAQAWSRTVERHESLRTRIVTTDGIPHQVVGGTAFAVDIEDARHLSAEEGEAEAMRLGGQFASRPFALAEDSPIRVLIVRVDGNRSLLCVSMHHVVGDLWAMGILGREVTATYDALKAGRNPELAPLPVQYSDFSVWQRAWLQGPELQRQLSFWREQLRGIEPLSIPTDRPRHSVTDSSGRRVRGYLEPQLVSAVEQLAKSMSCTPFMVLLAVFKVLLSRYARVQDVAIGVPVANRTALEVEDLVGTFVNTLVLRSDLSQKTTFAEVLEEVRSVAIEAFVHQDLPFEKLVSELNPDRDGRAPLVQVLFNVANAPLSDREPAGVTISPAVVDNGGAQFDLTLSAYLGEPSLVTLTYNPGLHDDETAERLVQHFVGLLEEVTQRPGVALAELRMIGRGEHESLIDGWNETARDFPLGSTFPELFAARAAASPDRVALVVDGESMTYGDLHQSSEVIAETLRSRGVGRGDRVAVLLDRDARVVISLLGVMKSGAAYVPLDPEYPAGRLAYVLEDAGCRAILTQPEHTSMVEGTSAEVLLVDDQLRGQDRPEAPASAVPLPQDPAYLIYTSGSTGRPKGVVIPHRALVNFLYSMAETPGLTEADVLAAVTTVSFDIVGLELYLPLLVGGRIVLLSQEQSEDGYRLADALRDHEVTAMQATPATWRLLLESGWDGAPDLKALCGGEALPLDLAAALLPKIGELWNMYGPTETTIWSTVQKIETGQPGILIGRPIGNTRVYILDEVGRPVPVGVAGEIFIAGDGVAQGYYNRPELTAERFVEDPFQATPGRRMYRTGDLGRYRPGGRIEHLGRMDHQVKIRGFRIELGEIEAVLAQQEGILEAVAAVHADRLVAYVVFEPGRELTVTEVRRLLRDDLPRYMIPAIVVPVDAIPLTPNGKVDRASLPDPFQQGLVAKREYVEPDTPLARVLAGVWGELLGVERVGLHDNFFDLGGHSLLAMQVVARVQESIGYRLDPRAMFFQTLGQIAGAASEQDTVRTPG